VKAKMRMSMNTEEKPNEPGWLLTVDPSSDGERLDRFISSRIPRLSRARASRLQVFDLKEPSKNLKKSCAVRAGQQLWARRPIPDPKAPLFEPNILHEEEGLLVLDKPSGVAVHPTASRFMATITYWLAKTPRWAHLNPAHRLDVETSGVLICCDKSNLKVVAAAFAARQVQKTYVAVLVGVPTADQWTVREPLGLMKNHPSRVLMGPGSLLAETQYQVQTRGENTSLVHAFPATGRQHQIRVHAQMSGYPLVGDKLYGSAPDLFIASKERQLTDDEWQTLGHTRHALHAFKTSLKLNGVNREFLAPIPKDLTALLEK
jgi:23S rRNA pseudouridine1911/1915/1917 synthase